MRQRLQIGLAVVLSFLWIDTGAQAQTRVAVQELEGPRAARVRNQVVSALANEDSVELVTMEDARQEPQAADAIIGGRVQRRGRRYNVELTVESSSGDPIGHARFGPSSLRALGSLIQSRLWDELSEPVEQAALLNSHGASRAIVVGDITGPGGRTLRARVVDVLSLREDVAVVPLRDLEAEANRLEVDLHSAAGRVRVAAELQVSAFVEGRVLQRGPRRRVVHITVLNALDGRPVGSVRVSARSSGSLANRVEETLWSRIGSHVLSTHAPRLDAEAALDVGSDSGEGVVLVAASSEAGSSAMALGRSALSLSVEGRGFNRTLSFKDDIFGAMRGYRLGLAPSASATIRWFPASHFTRGIASNLGIELTAEGSLFVQSENTDGSLSYPTSMAGFSANVLTRIPVGPHTIGSRLGYGGQSFHVDAIDMNHPAPDMPNADYRYLRLGTEADVRLGDFGLRGGLAYLYLLSDGPIGTPDWFPRTTGGGIEGAGRVAYWLFSDLELHVGFEVRRFFFSFNPVPGDPRVAGGGADQYTTATLGATWHLPTN